MIFYFCFYFWFVVDIVVVVTVIDQTEINDGERSEKK